MYFIYVLATISATPQADMGAVEDKIMVQKTTDPTPIPIAPPEFWSTPLAPPFPLKPVPKSFLKLEIAVPNGNLSNWVTTDDYPESALINEHQGVVGFTIEVNKNGIPKTCFISVSSGYTDLDEITCKLILERARFSPSKNKRGRAVTSKYSSRVRWQIPSD